MPNVGEIKHGREIGKKPLLAKFIWAACVDCGKERWVALDYEIPRNPRCLQCASKENAPRRCGSREKGSGWKGGRRTKANGYVQILLPKDTFFYPMAVKQGYILEHRLVMAQHLKRCLLPWEVVHHRNGIKGDNRIENLELLPTPRYHVPSMRWQQEVNKLSKRIGKLGSRIMLLEAENTVLRKQLEQIKVII